MTKDEELVPFRAMTFVPENFVVPRGFAGSGFHLEPLGPEHNERDHEAWMSSIDHINATPGFERADWPVPMTLAQNLEDLEMHAGEFGRREAFTYSILSGDQVIGCVYVRPGPTGTGADVTSWVRASSADLDAPIRASLHEWLTSSWPFSHVNYATEA
jgi:hypothetical protein